MPPRRSCPRKRAAPDAVADVGSALGESQHTPAQFDKDLEIERLRLENEGLNNVVARKERLLQEVRDIIVDLAVIADDEWALVARCLREQERQKQRQNS